MWPNPNVPYCWRRLAPPPFTMTNNRQHHCRRRGSLVCTSIFGGISVGENGIGVLRLDLPIGGEEALDSAEYPLASVQALVLNTNNNNVAQSEHALLLAQVGPSAFYDDEQPPTPLSSSWIFGMHVDSAEYPLARTESKRALLLAQVGPSALYDDEQPPTPLSSLPWIFGMHVALAEYPLARTESEFFVSTCRSAARKLEQ
jgi:hypothetical protein